MKKSQLIQSRQFDGMDSNKIEHLLDGIAKTKWIKQITDQIALHDL